MNKNFFISNRKKLLAELNDDAVLVAFSGMPKHRSADDDYEFSVNRDFWYLTGIGFKNIVYLAVKKNGMVRETVYLPPVDYMTERWHGRMLHSEQVEDISGVKEHKLRDEFMSDFWKAAKDGAPTVWIDIDPPSPGQDPELPEQFLARIRGEDPELKTDSYFPVMQRLRMVKTSEEIEKIREAIDLTKEGIARILDVTKPGMYEYNVRAEFEKVLADKGCRIPAFPTIIGAGKNSLCLHYSEDDALIRDGDIVLLDLGAQIDSHCADISRVFPANGKFTERQRALCRIACDTVDYCAAHAWPGMSIKDMNALQDEFLIPALDKIGLHCDSAEDLKNKYRWHNISHHLGIDTHDSCGRDALLVEGSVFSLEVGIYVEDWGEGVRVEDDGYMTKDGCENLSRHIPRTPDEIEAVMAERV